MGCTSTKQVSAVPSSEDGRSNAYSNGDLLSDEYRTKGVEKVKYMSGEDGEGDHQDSTVRFLILIHRTFAAISLYAVNGIPGKYHQMYA